MMSFLLPCYQCGKTTSDASLDRYLKEKQFFSVVLLTCHRDYCTEKKSCIFKTERKRAARNTFQHKKNILEKMIKKRKLQQLIQNQNNDNKPIVIEESETEDEENDQQMN